MTSSEDQHNGDEQPPPKIKKLSQDEEEPKALLACPFYRKDARTYHSCLNYKLRRIKDVKQHIFRTHKQPDFYCARCYKVFPGSVDRDSHIRKASCNMRSKSHFPGISEEQRKALSLPQSRGKPVPTQWHEMWDIISPTELHDKSCYLGNHWEEIALVLRSFWEGKRDAILDGLDAEPDRIERVMDKMFKSLKDELSIQGPGSSSIEPRDPPILSVPPNTDCTNDPPSVSQTHGLSDEDASWANPTGKVSDNINCPFIVGSAFDLDRFCSEPALYCTDAKDTGSDLFIANHPSYMDAFQETQPSWDDPTWPFPLAFD